MGDDVFRGCPVGLSEILGITGEAAPAEGTVAEIEETGPEDVFHVGREDEAVQVIFTVAADALLSGIVDGFQEAVAVVEEIGAALVEARDHFVMAAEGLVDEFPEGLRILVEHFRAFFVGEALRAVAAVIGHVAGSLVGHQVHVDIFLVQVFEEVDDVAVIGDRAGLAFLLMRKSNVLRLFKARGTVADPALRKARVDAGVVHFGDDGRRSCDHSRLALRAGHAAEAGGNEETSPEVSVVRDAQLQPAGIEERVEGAVHDALRADIHPAARGHLAVVRDAEGGGAVEILLIVKCADHKPVCDHDARRALRRMEQSQRMSGHDDQRLLVGQFLQILLDEPVLHPVLADLAGLAVGGQFVWIQRDVEVQVVVDHDLDRAAFDAFAFVFRDRLSVDPSFRTEAIAVDASVFLEFFGKFLRHLSMVFRRNIAKRVPDGQRLVRFRQFRLAARRPSDARFHFRISRKIFIQFDGHALRCEIDHVPLSFNFFRTGPRKPPRIHLDMHYISFFPKRKCFRVSGRAGGCTDHTNTVPPLEA